MAASDQIRNGIIEKLLTISNKDYLTALLQLVQNSAAGDDKVSLSKEQILMLNLSEKDISQGKLIANSDLEKADLKWLKEQ